MKDINKIREEYEIKVKQAEIANNFEAVYNIEPIVFKSSGKTFVSVSVDNATAKRILSDLQPEKEMLVNDTATGQKKPVYSLYRLDSNRGFSDRFSTLEIRFFNNGLCYWLKLQINENSVLDPFFNDGVRNIADFERSTYKPTKRGICVRNYDIPCKRFKGDYIAYVGGHYVSTDLKVINDIIEAIKNS